MYPEWRHEWCRRAAAFEEPALAYHRVDFRAARRARRRGASSSAWMRRGREVTAGASPGAARRRASLHVARDGAEARRRVAASRRSRSPLAEGLADGNSSACREDDLEVRRDVPAAPACCARRSRGSFAPTGGALAIMWRCALSCPWARSSSKHQAPSRALRCSAGCRPPVTDKSPSSGVFRHAFSDDQTRVSDVLRKPKPERRAAEFEALSLAWLDISADALGARGRYRPRAHLEDRRRYRRLPTGRDGCGFPPRRR